MRVTMYGWRSGVRELVAEWASDPNSHPSHTAASGVARRGNDHRFPHPCASAHEPPECVYVTGWHEPCARDLPALPAAVNGR